MIKFKNILELIRLAWKANSKIYLLISDKGVIECETYLEAKKLGLEMIKTREVDLFRIAMELTVVEFNVEIKK